MKQLMLSALPLFSTPALAQTTPLPYEFLTLAAVESSNSKISQITFAPSFQGKTQVPLEEIPVSFGKTVLAHQYDLLTVNQQLEAVTGAG